MFCVTGMPRAINETHFGDLNISSSCPEPSLTSLGKSRELRLHHRPPRDGRTAGNTTRNSRVLSFKDIDARWSGHHLNTLGCKVRPLRSRFAVPAEPLCSRAALLGTRRGDSQTSDLPSPSAPATLLRRDRTNAGTSLLCKQSLADKTSLATEHQTITNFMLSAFNKITGITQQQQEEEGGKEIKMRMD